MRTLLVRPDLIDSPQSLLRYGIKHQPLGLLYLAAALEEAGFSAAICDEAVGDDIFKVIDRFEPDLIGFTITTPLIPRVKTVVPEIHRRGIHVIIGGPHVSALPRESLLDTGADAAVVGEGELVIVDMARAGGPDKWGGIKGVSIRKNGETTDGGRAPMIEDLNSLPLPARHLLDPRKYMGDGDMGFYVKPDENCIRLQTSRGCPFQCTFCAAHAVVGRKVRYRSLDLVMEELKKHTLAWNAKKVMFNDDLFTANIKRVRTLCKMLIDEKLNITWGCFTRVGLDEETLLLMKESGCTMVGYGIESGSPRILKMLKKQIDPEKVIKSVRLTNQIGIKTKTFFMIGLPDETDEDVEMSIDLARRCRSNYLTLFTFTPLAGSEIYDNLSPEEMEIYSNRTYVEVADKRLRKLQRRFLMRFHLRWHYIWNTVRKFSVSEFRYFLGLAKSFISG